VSRALAALVVGLGLAAAVGCGGRGAPPAARQAVLVIDCEVADAALWIDEGFVAEIREARGGIRMPPGSHRVEIRHDRYHAYYGEIALEPGERRVVTVELAERLD
jgi:hypothetical protein